MNTKKQYGQFMTTNFNYILQNINIPINVKNIIEPFCGNGDLLNFININNIQEYNIECYDIEPKKQFIIKKDTLRNPPNYKNKFLLTNPPYLARNKSTDKYLFDKYDVNDLYKCLIKELLTNSPDGGILIIPLNYWSSIRVSDIKLRKDFLKVFDVLQLNIFEEQVFDDTTYTVCSFLFELKKNNINNNINIDIYPSKKKISIKLDNNNNYSIGGEIYNLKLNNSFSITRATSKNKNNTPVGCNTNILVKCIDDNINNLIGLSIVNDKDRYIDETPNLSSRTYATLIIIPSINESKQKKLVEEFNKFLYEYRNKYNSLFLTNYRESKDISRKRISFELVYNIVEYILENKIK